MKEILQRALRWSVKRGVSYLELQYSSLYGQAIKLSSIVRNELTAAR